MTIDEVYVANRADLPLDWSLTIFWYWQKKPHSRLYYIGAKGRRKNLEVRIRIICHFSGSWCQRMEYRSISATHRTRRRLHLAWVVSTTYSTQQSCTEKTCPCGTTMATQRQRILVHDWHVYDIQGSCYRPLIIGTWRGGGFRPVEPVTSKFFLR